MSHAVGLLPALLEAGLLGPLAALARDARAPVDMHYYAALALHNMAQAACAEQVGRCVNLVDFCLPHV